MAESRRLSDFGPISLLLTHERSLREVLATLARYRTHVNEALDIRIEEFGDIVLVREDLYIDGLVYPRQAYELALGVLYRMCAAVLGPRWRPISIHFAHKAPPNLDAHRRIFGAECVFESEFNGMMCRAGDLDLDNQKGDPALARYAEKLMHALPKVGAASPSEDVRRAIQTLLPTHRATIAGVAASLGVNVRTLQRRLEAEGVLFADLLTQVRRELAEHYLADKDCSLTHVAALLGYGQLSSFTRWFTAEYKLSPSAWRSSARSRRG
jgi:AraC-like DNA-binding protein